MGFLKTKGKVIPFNEYKEKIEKYKMHGLMQFVSIYKAHKDRFIPVNDLKWGEEMEYQIFVWVECEDNKVRLQLSNRGPELIDTFNSSELAKGSGLVLLPEFGGWMCEAVPNEPYSSISDPDVLLSCHKKL